MIFWLKDIYSLSLERLGSYKLSIVAVLLDSKDFLATVTKRLERPLAKPCP
jgi:hypothetical protein